MQFLLQFFPFLLHLCQSTVTDSLNVRQGKLLLFGFWSCIWMNVIIDELVVIVIGNVIFVLGDNVHSTQNI